MHKSNQEVIDILKKVGAVLPNDHFVGTSGLHFDTYINKDFLYPHTEDTKRVCELMAESTKAFGADVVVGPALGGIILSQWTAYFLSQSSGKEILGVYTEKKDGAQVFTRGYDNFVKGKKVLIVEDITTTGGSVVQLINLVKDAGGEVAGVAVMLNKNPKLVNKELFGVSFVALTEYEVTTYEATECPFCKNGVPVNTKVGHGKKFLEAQKSNE